MHTTFTGSGRRQRQINLSGRTTKTNPFGSIGGSQSATAKALSERAERQHQQALSSAARKAQRLWRGRIGRIEAANQLYADYVQHEESYSGQRVGDGSYETYDVEGRDQALLQLRRLLGFFDPATDSHIKEVWHLVQRLAITASQLGPIPQSYDFVRALCRLEDKVIAALSWHAKQAQIQLHSTQPTDCTSIVWLCRALQFLSTQLPLHTLERGPTYFGAIKDVLAVLAHSQENGIRLQPHTLMNADVGNIAVASVLERLILGPLSYQDDTARRRAYFLFAVHMLSCHPIVYQLDTALDPIRDAPSDSAIVATDTLPQYVGGGALLNRLADTIVTAELASAIRTYSSEYDSHLQERSSVEKIRTLASYVYIQRRQTLRSGEVDGDLRIDRDLIYVASRLLGAVPDEERTKIVSGRVSDEEGSSTVDSFITHQMSFLASEQNVRNLLSDAQSSDRVTAVDATVYAVYALTLIRTFPEMADQIRMWLFLGPKRSSGTSHQSAIRLFWQAARNTDAFAHISKDNKSLRYIVLDKMFAEEPERIPVSAEDDWRVILMFLELYTFVLKVMDDDEFFSLDSGSSPFSSGATTSTRASALPLKEVESLVTFLRNLGLSLFLDVARVTTRSSQVSGATSISDFFRKPQQADDIEPTPAATLTGPTGASMEYFQTLVTGLLRMLYERDSRRTFLPKGHWLMNHRFESLFNAEDLFKQLVQLQGHGEDGNEIEEDGDDMDGIRITRIDEEPEDERNRIYGTGQAERIRHHDTLRVEQKRINDERQRLFLKPRFGVMDNMPYTIPFLKRVSLFHDFVQTDKVQRRYGAGEADHWRVSVLSRGNGSEVLQRQQADIRRGHELEDAFDHFFPIGEHLKEPIQITFLDDFNNPEAGIDGGGVTKEFLTSVTRQIKWETGDQQLFAETKENLLYPNQTAIDDVMETSGGNKEVRQHFCQRYEFMGRIVGKCLYENILVDLPFAPFFLQKWALAGDNPRSQARYRATLDDLRQFDEELYRGLLQLKNHPGNVEEDFDQDFIITDDAKNLYSGKTNHIVRELIPGGSNKKVTNENRLLYIFAVAKHRLVTQQAIQTASFLKGLSLMIKPQWLRMFNQHELQTLLRGTSSPLDLADLRRATHYNGLYVVGDDKQLHPTIEMFWRVLESLDEDSQRAVLKFVTSTPRAPLLGFSALFPPFTIRDSSRDQGRLPTASTCVNLLKLPLYESEDVLREKLLYAVGAGAGFDLS